MSQYAILFQHILIQLEWELCVGLSKDTVFDNVLYVELELKQSVPFQVGVTSRWKQNRGQAPTNLEQQNQMSFLPMLV